MNGEFHQAKGLYFKREEDGSVTIRKASSAKPDAPAVFEQTIPSNEWASIVAAVSEGGETALSYQGALILHGGPVNPVRF